MCSWNSRGRGLDLIFRSIKDFFRSIAHAFDASSIYFTEHDFALDSIRGVGFENGLGMSGLNRAPLNFTMKKKQPKNTP